jgi:hypothetical protein
MPSVEVVNVHGGGVVNVHDGRRGKPTQRLADCQLRIGVAGPAGDPAAMKRGGRQGELLDSPYADPRKTSELETVRRMSSSLIG